jgi:phosphotransferase family enzyme
VPDVAQWLGRPLAEALTAEVYGWDETRIVKLVRSGGSLDQAEYEARITRAVHAAGVPVPAVGHVVELDGRHGLLSERVEYVQLRPEGRRQYEAWKPIVAAARLGENVPGVQPWLLATVSAGPSGDA